MSYTERVVVNHISLCCAGWMGIMVCYAVPVVVYHCVILIRVCGNHSVNAMPVGVNHSELC